MRTKVVVTVNPEFMVEAAHNREFYDLLAQARYVVPDGRGIQLAGEYAFVCRLTMGWPGWARAVGNLVMGLGLGLWDVVGGLKYRVFPRRLTGVEMMLKLVAMAAQRDRKVMLLGGKPASLADEAAQKLRMAYPRLKIVSDPGHIRVESEDDRYKRDEARIMAVLKKERPDYLLVAYGAPRQEKWLFSHQDKLSSLGVRLAMGVGGALEYVLRAKINEGKLELGISRHEWCCRLRREPRKRLVRIYRAVVVFPFLIYQESLSQSGNGLTNFGRLTKLIMRWSKYKFKLSG